MEHHSVTCLKFATGLMIYMVVASYCNHFPGIVHGQIKNSKDSLIKLCMQEPGIINVGTYFRCLNGIPSSKANLIRATDISVTSLTELAMLQATIIANDVLHFKLLSVVSAAWMFCRWLLNLADEQRSHFSNDSEHTKLNWFLRLISYKHMDFCIFDYKGMQNKRALDHNKSQIRIQVPEMWMHCLAIGGFREHILQSLK